MSIRSQDEALEALKGRQGRFVALIQRAVGTFYAQCGPITYALEGWTRASIIRDLAKEDLYAASEEDSGLKVHKKGNATSVHIAGAFSTRIKKLDEKLRARVSKTRASRAFNANARQTELGLGDRPLTTSYLGYVPNENDPLQPDVFFVVNDAAGRHAWEPIPLRLDEANQAPVKLPEAEPESPVPEKRRARVRRSGTKQSGHG